MRPVPAPVSCLWQGFPWCSVGKESACNAGDLSSIPGSGRSPGEGNGNPLQYSCLGNPKARGASWATVHGVARVGHDLVTKPPPPRLPCQEGQPKQKRMGGVPDRREETIRRPRLLKFTRKILRVEGCTERGKSYQMALQQA